MIKKNTNSGQARHGFTLIEVLVVIFIIGVLVSLITANILGARQRAEDVQRKNDLQQMQKALRLFYNDFQRYPDETMAGDPVLNNLKGKKFEVGDTVYMGRLPEEFAYYVDNSNDMFRLWVALDNPSDQDIAKSQERCSPPAGSGLTYEENAYVVCEY